MSDPDPSGLPHDPSTASATDATWRTERMAATLLRTGVAASIAVIGAGVALTLVRHPEYLSDPRALGRLTAPGAAFPHQMDDLLAELASGRGRAVVTAGLLLLIATPVMRVAASVVSFLRQRDRAFAAITLGVLSALILSLVLGQTG